MRKYFCICLIGALFASCSPTGYIRKAATATLLGEDILKSAHTGICIYDATDNKYLYNYQSDKYFVPASNTKIFSLYAGMKYLGDSLPGMRYQETDDSLVIYPTGDPTLLHPDFRNQPVIEKLKSTHKTLSIDTSNWKTLSYGRGWAWDDYNEGYMPERSAFPVYGNVIKWMQSADPDDSLQAFIFSEPEVNWPVRFIENRSVTNFYVTRKKEENFFWINQGKEEYKEQQVPFITNGVRSAIELLKDTVDKELTVTAGSGPQTFLHTIYSQPSDSLFRPMMHRSDNFFAEQTLLMVADKVEGVMNDEAVINKLLDTDLKGLPQKPNWVDGSGLSRYNLFTPQDFVWILNKMKNEFGLERLKNIFPTGGQGTLKHYYQQDSTYIYAKTGSLSGQTALTGFLITRKNKLLLFSILINNHNSSATAVRRSIEDFLIRLRKRA